MKYKYSEKEYVEKRDRYMVDMPGNSPVVMVEAKGSIVKDIDGKEYIDGMSLVAGATGIGSSHPKVIEAVKKQLDKMPCITPGFVNIPKVELAEKLARIMPGNLSKFHFFCGGGESVEFAVKSAIKSSKKREVIGLYLGYHGVSIANLSLGNPYHRKGLPTVPGFRQIQPAYCYRCYHGKEYPGCNFECARALEHMIQEATYHDVAAFVMEPMLGVGGHIIPPDREYFKIIREICAQYGVLLIFDEIQNGFGRTGKMWAADYYEVQPDIMVIGKAMGGGIPISGVAFREDFVQPSEEEQEILSTFSGNPIGCAAASAVVDVVLEEKLPEKAAKMGAFMMEKVNEMKERHPLIGDVRGAGLFIGVELVKDRESKEKAVEEALRVLEECLKRGAIFALSQKGGVGNVIKIKPPMNISKDLASKSLDILDASLYEVEKSLNF